MKKLSVMLLALAGLFIFTGCDSSKKTIEKWGESVADFAGFREDPKHIAGKWMTAILDGDVKKANKNSTEETHIANGLLIGMVNGEHKYTKVIRATFETWIESLKNAKEEIIDDDAAKVIIEGE